MHTILTTATKYDNNFHHIHIINTNHTFC